MLGAEKRSQVQGVLKMDVGARNGMQGKGHGYRDTGHIGLRKWDVECRTKFRMQRMDCRVQGEGHRCREWEVACRAGDAGC